MTGSRGFLRQACCGDGDAAFPNATEQLQVADLSPQQKKLPHWWLMSYSTELVFMHQRAFELGKTLPFADPAVSGNPEHAYAPEPGQT